MLSHRDDVLRGVLLCVALLGLSALTFGKRKAGIDSKKYVEIYRQCQMTSYKW